MSHLDFYIKHGISPVRYDMSSLAAHFERRESLYRSLGLPRLAFRNSDVLEVAAGSGHNSLYLASLMPRTLTLVEPNPAGLADITATYSGRHFPHTLPHIVQSKLEDFEPTRLFDIVLCENWLGSSLHERSLLRKLGTFVAPGGVLVVTTISPVGFIPNLIRRALGAKLVDPRRSFDENTKSLVAAFGSHLDSIEGMTRTKEDWVQDNLLNPVYFDLCLSIPQAVDELGQEFEIAGSSPSIAQDWRWFKSLHGESRNLNGHFLNEYWEETHNFFDYRRNTPRRDVSANLEFHEAALSLIENVRAFECNIDQRDEPSPLLLLLAQITKIEGLINPICPDWRESVREAKALLAEPVITPHQISALPAFGRLFGRETVYISFTRHSRYVEDLA